MWGSGKLLVGNHDTWTSGIVATQGSPSTLKIPTPSYPGNPSLFVRSLGTHFSKIFSADKEKRRQAGRDIFNISFGIQVRQGVTRACGAEHFLKFGRKKIIRGAGGIWWREKLRMPQPEGGTELVRTHLWNILIRVG